MHAIALALVALSVTADPVKKSEDIAEVWTREFVMPLYLQVPATSVEQVRMFVSTDRGKSWKPAGEYVPTAGDVRFKAPAEGLYYFAVKVIFKDGRTDPAEGEALIVAQRVHVRAARPEARVVLKLAPSATSAKSSYLDYTINGFKVRFNDQWFSPETPYGREMMSRLRRQIDLAAAVLPVRAADRLSDVAIWVEWEVADVFPSEKPHSAMYMPRAYRREADARLSSKSGDIVVFAQSCLAGDAGAVADGHAWLVHEMAHAYHERVPDFNGEIDAAYKAAVDAKSYEKVDVRYPLPSGAFTTVQGRAYALTNAKEYFAELTVAHLARSMVYPHTRSDLKKHDPRGHALMMKVWGDNAERRNQIVDGLIRAFVGLVIVPTRP